jgi:hypothetical protein
VVTNPVQQVNHQVMAEEIFPPNLKIQ